MLNVSKTLFIYQVEKTGNRVRWGLGPAMKVLDWCIDAIIAQN